MRFITTFISIHPLHNSTSNFITKIFSISLTFSLLLSSSSLCFGQLARGRGNGCESRVEGRHQLNASLHAPEVEKHGGRSVKGRGPRGGIGCWPVKVAALWASDGVEGGGWRGT
jgi:hypothetical protein